MIAKHISTILRSYPNVATRIGFFFAEYAVVERELDWVFAAHLGPYQSLREHFFRPRDGIPQKVPVIGSVLRRLAPESPLARVLEEKRSEIEDLVAFRNALAHGIYGEFEGNDLRVTRPGTKDDGERAHKLSVDTMHAWLHRLGGIGDALVEALSAAQALPDQSKD